MRAVEEKVDQPAEPVSANPPVHFLRRRAVRAWAAWLSYPVLAVVVLIQLWISPSGRVLSHNDDDHGFFLFVATHGERVLFHGDNPLFSGRINVPDGVNMMANTTILALTLPLAPITHFFGPGVTVVLLLTLGLAGTAAAWFWVFSRHLVRNRFAAWIGGLWCGFCPAMVSHANGHINFVSQFVVPFLVWQVLRLREPGRVLRGGVIVGLLIVLQVFLNEEVLLFTALTLGVFVIAYAVLAWDVVRQAAGRFAAGLGVAAVTSGVLLAYPLWFQFTGPGSYQGQPFVPGKFVTDLLAVGAYARQSLAGNNAVGRWLSISPTEDNTFFGLPMLALLVVSLILLRRAIAAKATAVAALVLLIVSFGPYLRIGGWDSSAPMPFGLISHVPIIDLVSVTRFAMVTATLVGVLLALGVDRGLRLPRRRRIRFGVLLAVAIIPVLPKPLPTVPATPLPQFIADGMWRDYVPAGRSLVPVPLPEVTTGREGMRWVAFSGGDFPVPRGYFMGPVNPPVASTGSWNAPQRYTSDLLWWVRENGRAPKLNDELRARAMTDFTYWRTAVVVLVPGSENGDLLAATLTDLLQRQPQRVGGVLLWDMRDLPVPPRE